MRRREFVTCLGASAAAWPFTARAQQSERIRRIGVLMGYPDTDSEGQAGVAAFQEGLQQLGWSTVDKVRIDTRWAPPGNTCKRRVSSNSFLTSRQPSLSA